MASVFHTTLKPGLTVKVASDTDERPDLSTDVVVYMDGGNERLVPAGAAWANNPQVPSDAVDGTVMTKTEWQRAKRQNIDDLKATLRGLFEGLSPDQKKKLEMVFSDIETSELLREFIVEVLKQR